MRSNQAIGQVLAAIILIALTVVVSIAVAAFMGSLTFTFLKIERGTFNDVYDPRNSTLDEAYSKCLDELQRLNYTVYNAKFQRNVWIKTENFTALLKLANENDANVLFADSPKGRGNFFGIKTAPFKAYIWFNSEVDGETVVVYYELKK